MVLYEDDGKSVKFFTDNQHFIGIVSITELIEFFIINEGVEEMI